MNAEKLYNSLPVPLQNAACSLVGWRIQRTRFDARFAQMLAEAQQRAAWPPERRLEYRDQRLRAFVRHAAETVPYYRDLFREQNIDPGNIRALDDLKQLPILTKAEVQRQGDRMLSEAVATSQRVMAHTSGTTGGGLRFATTADAVREQWAVWWRYRRWHGIEPGTWCGYFGGRSVVPLGQQGPPWWRYNRPGRQILFSGYHLSPENMPAYVDQLRRRRPPWLHGYPSLLALLASYLLDSGEELGYALKAITIGAENLLPQQAALIERALGIRPRQHYGMAEAVANISETPDGTLMVDEDFAAVEFLPTNNGQHRIIGTNFSNPATPLLRYDVQDLATLEPKRGRDSFAGNRPSGCFAQKSPVPFLALRTVAAIDGRREDYVVLPGGARVGRMDHIFKDLTNIREAQIHQRHAERITIRVVRGGAYTEADEQRLLEETRSRLGREIGIEIEYVDRLPRSSTGKLRLVVSELEGGHITPEGAHGNR